MEKENLINQLQIVTKEQAIKLAKIGFDWESLHYYDKDTMSPCPGYTFNNSNGKIAAPTKSQAFKWLRDVHDIHGYTLARGYDGISFSYHYFYGKFTHCAVLSYDSWETAEDALLSIMISHISDELKIKELQKQIMPKLMMEDISRYFIYGLKITDICGDIYDVIRITKKSIHIKYKSDSKGKVGEICEGEFDKIKLILNPVEKLSEEIIYNGEVIVPLIEIAKAVSSDISWDKKVKKGEYNSQLMYVSGRKDNESYSLSVETDTMTFEFRTVTGQRIIFNSIMVLDMLNKYRIDYNYLIQKKLAVSVDHFNSFNTLVYD